MYTADVASKVAAFFNDYPRRTYAKDDIIIKPGQSPPAVYIYSGQIQQYDLAPGSEKKLIVNNFKAGAFIPLANILNNTTSDFYFAAATNVTTQQAPATKLIEFMQANPDCMFDALTRISRGTNGLLHRLASTMRDDAAGRVLVELQILQARFADDSGSLAITEEELANQTGLARETISRSLQSLRQQGIIKSSRGKIRLL